MIEMCTENESVPSFDTEGEERRGMNDNVSTCVESEQFLD